MVTGHRFMKLFHKIPAKKQFFLQFLFWILATSPHPPGWKKRVAGQNIQNITNFVRSEVISSQFTELAFSSFLRFCKRKVYTWLECVTKNVGTIHSKQSMKIILVLVPAPCTQFEHQCNPAMQWCHQVRTWGDQSCCVSYFNLTIVFLAKKTSFQSTGRGSIAQDLSVRGGICDNEQLCCKTLSATVHWILITVWSIYQAVLILQHISRTSTSEYLTLPSARIISSINAASNKCRRCLHSKALLCHLKFGYL